MDDDGVELASIYRLTAVAFRHNAEIIEKDFSRNNVRIQSSVFSIPYYYLISHACELFLKSALLKRGIDQERLRQYGLRHNLSGMMDELKLLNVRISGKSIFLVIGLSEQHKDSQLRYTALLDDGKATFMPRPAELGKLLDELMLLTRLSS